MNLRNTILKQYRRKQQIKKALIQLAVTVDTDLTVNFEETSVYFEDETFDMKPLLFVKPEVIYSYLIKNVSFDLEKLYHISIYKDKLVVKRNEVVVNLDYFDNKKMKRLKKWAKSLDKELKKRKVLRIVDYPFRESRFLGYDDIARYIKPYVKRVSEIKALPDGIVIYR